MYCHNSKKVVTIMKTFAKNASGFTFKFFKGQDFQVFLPDNLPTNMAEYFVMLYNFNQLSDLTDFRRCWTPAYPALRGFATITLTLLHEIGHVMTADAVKEYSNEQREKDIAAIEQSEEWEEYYFLPDERAATEWAIEWLKNSENRKIAKKFEKEFFECFVRG